MELYSRELYRKGTLQQTDFAGKELYRTVKCQRKRTLQERKLYKKGVLQNDRLQERRITKRSFTGKEHLQRTDFKGKELYRIELPRMRILENFTQNGLYRRQGGGKSFKKKGFTENSERSFLKNDFYKKDPRGKQL